MYDCPLSSARATCGVNYRRIALSQVGHQRACIRHFWSDHRIRALYTQRAPRTICSERNSFLRVCIVLVCATWLKFQPLDNLYFVCHRGTTSEWCLCMSRQTTGSGSSNCGRGRCFGIMSLPLQCQRLYRWRCLPSIARRSIAGSFWTLHRKGEVVDASWPPFRLHLLNRTTILIWDFYCPS